MNQNKGIWTGVVVIILVAVLGIWWLTSNQYIDMSTLGGAKQTDQQATTTTTTDTNNSGANTNTGATGAGKTSASSSVNVGAGGATSNGAGGHVAMKDQTVKQIVEGLSGSSQFKSLFNSTGVGASLSANTKYTIFVPTDGAISQLPKSTISSMTAVQLKRLIQYHIVAGRALDLDAVTAGQIQALSGDALNISFGANKIPSVNSAIKITEYDGKNGIVYVIDNVLVPPKKAPGTL